MACGRPIVATDAGGARYLVDDEGGRRVPPGSPAALADALIEILRSPSLQAGMGRHNREQVERVYCWDRVIAGLVDVYRSVVASTARPA
jgi:glycosyltransferase involved in cell wall biosynthesis